MSWRARATVTSTTIGVGTNRGWVRRPPGPSDPSGSPMSFAMRRAPAWSSLVREHDLTDNDVQDAFLVALAPENGAPLVTRDRGFRRFAPLRVLAPPAPPAP